VLGSRREVREFLAAEVGVQHRLKGSRRNGSLCREGFVMGGNELRVIGLAR